MLYISSVVCDEWFCSNIHVMIIFQITKIDSGGAIDHFSTLGPARRRNLFETRLYNGRALLEISHTDDNFTFEMIKCMICSTN
jgi:hypothetical protein